MKKLQEFAIVGVLLVLSVWIPIAYTGIPKSNLFSLHILHMIDAGIISYQPWTDQNGMVHPFREYGFANLQWNTSNIIDGYQVETYDFSNIPNITGVDWDFQALVAKVQNGSPVYESVFPNINGPAYPFDATNFQIQAQSFKSYHALWLGNSTVYLSDPAGNLTIRPLNWSDADYGLRSQIGAGISQTVQALPRSAPVKVNFTANWHVQAMISSADAGLNAYGIGFDRSAMVTMSVRNGTVLNATGTFYVHTTDGPSTEITYRSISLADAIYATIGIVIAVSLVSLLVFRREVWKQLRPLGERERPGPATPPSGSSVWVPAQTSSEPA